MQYTVSLLLAYQPIFVHPCSFQQYVAPLIRATYFFGSEYIFRFLFYAM